MDGKWCWELKMVWSISKNDDGLESTAAQTKSSSGSSMHGAYAPSSVRPPRTPLPAATVVVDPVSQIPDAFPHSPEPPRFAEPTRIISSRKIDALRAQVARHQKRQQQRVMLQWVIWGAAGALAVALGGILAGGVLPRLDTPLWHRLVAQVRGEATASSDELLQVQQTQLANSLPPPPEASPAPVPVPSQMPNKPAVTTRPRTTAAADARPVSLDELETE